MKKTLLYLLILVVLGGAAWYFVFKKDAGVFSEREAGFTIKDTANIGKIYMTRTSGQSVTLERVADGWKVDGDHKALKTLVNVLLTTLAQQVAQYPVPENAHNMVVKTMSGTSVKVEVYDLKDKLLRTFYVGSESHDYGGTFMLMEGAERPYVVQIPNFQGYLTTRYSTDLADWRDRTVFDVKPEEISSVSVEYPGEPLNSFAIKRAGGTPVVDVNPEIKGSKPLNLKRTESYLGFFSNVNAEGFLNGMQGIREALGQSLRRCAIELKDIHGGMQHVDVYWMPVNKRSKNRTESADQTPDEFDPDRFYGVMNNARDTVILQKGSFEKLFRKAWEFYEADKPAPVLGIDNTKAGAKK